MKKLFISILILMPFVFCSVQGQPGRPAQSQQKQEYPARMTPQMTEFFEPAVPVIQPGAQVGMPPSDAIVLFDG